MKWHSGGVTFWTDFGRGADIATAPLSSIRNNRSLALAKNSLSEWLYAGDALEEFARQFNGETIAQTILLRCLQAGYVKAQGEIFKSRGAPRAEFQLGGSSLREISTDAWELCESPELENWQRNRFEFRTPFGEASCEIYNVKLLRADMAEIFSKDRGGRPLNQEAWNAFWFVILQMAMGGRLNSSVFSTEASFQKAVYDETRDSISEKSIKSTISQIYRKLVAKN